MSRYIETRKARKNKMIVCDICKEKISEKYGNTPKLILRCRAKTITYDLCDECMEKMRNETARWYLDNIKESGEIK